MFVTVSLNKNSNIKEVRFLKIRLHIVCLLFTVNKIAFSHSAEALPEEQKRYSLSAGLVKKGTSASNLMKKNKLLH